MSTDPRLMDFIREQPHIETVFRLFRLLFASTELFRKAIFYKSHEWLRTTYTLPAVGPFRINEVSVGNGTVYFKLLMTPSGFIDDLYEIVLIYEFKPDDEITFYDPRTIRRTKVTDVY